jgi:hypothetical protein
MRLVKIRNIKKKIPLKYLTLILSIIGVILLYVLTLFQQPVILTSVQSIEDYEGKEVTLNGTVLDYTITNYGSQLITIQCNSTKLTVFSDSPLTVHNGDIIQATGTIQEYKDSWELILNNPSSARITTTWQNRTVQIKNLANHPLDYINIPLNITGYIDIKYDDIVYLKDHSNNYTIPLIPPEYPIPKTGTPIYVHATLTYDPLHLRYMLTDCEKIQQISPLSEG